MTEVTEENLFGELWKGRAQLVNAILAHEPLLSRALSMIERAERQAELGATVATVGGGLSGGSVWRQRERVIGGKARLPLPDGSDFYTDVHVVGGGTFCPRHGTFDAVSVRYLVDLLRRERVDAVVELGSGIGQRLFQIFLAGGPRDIPYYGAELYEDARVLAERLGTLEPGMDLRCIPFDIVRPDFSFLAPYRRVLMFSNAAIYCVERLPANFFVTMALACPAVIGVHFELLGHQSGNGLDPASPAYEYARARRLNTDFIPKVLDAAKAGHVALDYLGPHYFSISSGQMVTAIQWRSII